MPGHDVNYIGLGGALDLIGDPDGKPTIPLNFLADWAGGALHAAIGILLALASREKTGKGQFVDIAMLDGVVSLVAAFARYYFVNSVVPRRGEMHLSGAYPYYRTYETKDGEYVALGCIEPWFWENFCREIGRQDFIPYHYAPEHALGGPREHEWQAVATALEEIFRQRSRDEWVEDLSSKNIPISKVYRLDEVFADPQVIHRGMIAELEHPKAEKVKQIGVAIKLSDTPGTIRELPPTLGRDTDSILDELGYGPEEAKRLRRSGVVL
jgi:crotonobetainyl-CoA:carnitine CoA-transferase CaiB-like acyl-CoA transferase